MRFLFLSAFFLAAIFQSFSQAYKGWQFIGPRQMKEQVKGFVQALWTDENDLNYLLAGSACGGLFKTENALSENPQWNCITDSYQGLMNYGVTGIAVNPNSSRKEIFISTGSRNGLIEGYGNGILKSADGGQNWIHVGPGSASDFTLCIDGLVMNREQPAEMIAWTRQDVYLTRDGWKTWENVNLQLDKNNRELTVADIEFAPFEAGKFYVGTRTYNAYNARVYSVENYGKNVKDISPAEPQSERMEIATVFNEKYKGKFYLALGSNNVFVKYYNGKNFSANLNSFPVSQLFASAFWCLEMQVNQKDTNLIYLAMTETSLSRDGGKIFDKITYYNGVNTHADNRAMLLARSSAKGENDMLLLGNDGGISGNKTADMKSWKNLDGTGLDNNMFWGIGVAQSDSLFVCGGAADNGGFMITEKESVNTMQGCGDGYASVALDANSCIIECNPPTMFYHNLKTGKTFYLYVPDDRFDNKRPLVKRDSVIYAGYNNIWKITKSQLEKGANRLEKVSNLPVVRRDDLIKNNIIRSLAVSRFNSAVVSFKHPNWMEPENNGKLFFTTDINKGKWYDITGLANFEKKFEICRWSEIYSLEMDVKNANKFYFISRDVFNQMGRRFFSMEYFPDSNKCVMKDIAYNLPMIGLNEVKADEFSNVLYVATDNGVWWMDLSADSLGWTQLNDTENRFPNVMVFDIDFNYTTNEIYAGTFGRGIWKTRMASCGKNNIAIRKNKTQNELMKIDGILSIGKKCIYKLNARMIITPTSKIEMKKGSQLIIKDRSLIRNANNEVVDISNFLPKKNPGKVIYLN